MPVLRLAGIPAVLRSWFIFSGSLRENPEDEQHNGNQPHCCKEKQCFYKENKEIFINSGFVIEEFGGNTISLKEVPYFLGKLDSRNFLLSIIDNLKNLGSGKTVEVKLNKIATMACKAAVKANDYLTQMEMEKLISDLRYIDNPFNCPHGRPIIIKFTEYELDKKFRRIV